MTRVVSVGRSKSLLAAGALGLAVLSLVGCPGTLDPSQFPQAGTAGSTGGPGTAGSSPMGTAGAMGTAGTGSCNMVNLITVKYTCTIAGACHDGTMASAAGLSMQQADWPKLVGGKPNAMAGAMNSICAKDPAFMNMPYITKGSATGDGLLIKKLMAPTCSPMGQQMPNLGTKVSAADMPCFQQWVTSLANM
jgi:hypothetical protein